MKTRLLLFLGAFLLGLGSWAQDTDVPSDIFYDSVRNISELNNLTLADAFPWISYDGLRIYYTQGNFSEKRLVVASRPDTLSLFGTPVEVSGVASVNSFSHWLSEDELTIFLCNGTSLYVSKRNNTISPFAIPALVSLTLPAHDFIFGPSLNADETKLYLSVILQDEFLGIYELSKGEENTFGNARKIEFPTGQMVQNGQLSKDGLVFFYSASVLGSLDQMYMLKKANTSETFDAGSSMKIGGINDPDFDNNQASMSDGLKWVAFVRSTGDSWNNNELYLAHLSYPAAIGETNLISDKVLIYPNPAGNWLVVEQTGNRNAKAEIYSVEGSLIKQYLLQENQTTIDLSGLLPGLYFIRIEREDGIAVQKIVKSL